MPTVSKQTPSSSVFPAPFIALAQWLVPGLGYCLIGQKARGVTIGLTVVILFVMGLLIGGICVVSIPTLPNDVGLMAQVREDPWLIGQILAGLPGLVSAYIARRVHFVASTSRVNEIGTLYTAIAGMLNLLAIIDSSYRSAHAEPKP